MKTRKCPWIAFLYLLTATCAFAAQSAPSLNSSKWQYRLPIEIPTGNAGGVVEFSLPPTVLAKAHRTLRDVRVVTSTGKTVAYTIRIQRGGVEHCVSYNPKKYLNNVFLPGKESSIVADFGSNKVRNFLDIVSSGNNFRRRVMVEGADDMQNWKVLSDNGWLFAIPGDHGGTHHVNRLELGENTFRYYRITVYPGDDDPEKIFITSVQAAHQVTTPPDVVAVPIVGMNISENAALHCTEIELDLGCENLLLHDLVLECSDPNFMRYCNVYGRNAKATIIRQRVENSQPREREEEMPWTWVANASIHRVTTQHGTSESLRIGCSGQFRYLLIRVRNRDDQQLTFTAAHVRRYHQRLRMQYAGKQSLYLLCGNPEASAPSYDLAHYIDSLTKDGLHPPEVGVLEPNPAFHAEEPTGLPWSERNRWVLTLAIVLMVLVLGVLVWRQARCPGGQ